MEEHFRAFSFVDRITAVQPGARITGAYTIPPGLDAFSNSLVAEAVGQLAAWSAMAAVNFERRPVAGIAGRIELLSSVRPGQVLELAAEMESVDAEAAAYSGTASADGIPIIRLEHCVGPMVPLADFDEPQAVRDRFALLCGSRGAVPGGFGGVPALALARIGGEAGKSARATLPVPASAPLFADHFPRRAVFPGSLLMNMKLQLAAALAAEIPPPAAQAGWKLGAVSNMKLRSFIPPGETLELEATLVERTHDSVTFTVESRRGQRVVGAANVVLVPEEIR